MGYTKKLHVGTFLGSLAPESLTATVSVGTVTYIGNTGSPGYDPGIAYMQTGASATGRAALASQLTIQGNNATSTGYCKCLIAAWDGASSGTDRYTIRAGFIDSVSAEPANGCFFRYSDNLNSSRWQCVTRAAGAETATDSGTTFNYASGTLEVFRNVANTSVKFMIAGVVVATNTTNIPTAAYGYGLSIIKSVGTGNSGIYVDEISAFV